MRVCVGALPVLNILGALRILKILNALWILGVVNVSEVLCVTGITAACKSATEVALAPYRFWWIMIFLQMRV